MTVLSKVLFASFIGTLLLLIEFLAATYFSPLVNPSDTYGDGEVQELSGFLRADGVDVPEIFLVPTNKTINASAYGLYQYCPTAWTMPGIIWALPEGEHSYYAIGHEMAHQVIFKKYPDFDGDQHDLVEFKQWEICLVASAKFHYNLCSVM